MFKYQLIDNEQKRMSTAEEYEIRVIKIKRNIILTSLFSRHNNGASVNFHYPCFQQL